MRPFHRQPPDPIREYLRNQDEFEQVTYPGMTWDQKVDFWVGDLHRMMRASGETSGDEYEGFQAQSYVRWRQFEPQIDVILGLLKHRLHRFDEPEMWRRLRADAPDRR